MSGEELLEDAEIKFTCPKCGQHLMAPRESLGQLVDCPACNTVVEVKRPRPRPPEPEPIPRPKALTEAEAKEIAQHEADQEWKAIRANGKAIEGFGFACFFLFVITVMAGIMGREQMGWAGPMGLAGIFLAAAFWLMLLAQLFFIRAAVERRQGGDK